MKAISVFTSDKPMVLIGCGKMGSALLDGWLNAGLDPKAVYIVDPGLDQCPLGAVPKRNILEAIGNLPKKKNPSLMLLAIKPQVMVDVLPMILETGLAPDLVLSIAAGTTIRTISEGFPDGTQIFRAMPNTPAAVGEGITAVVRNMDMAKPHEKLITQLLSGVGDVIWINREADLDAVTAVSGSGPAYVFHLVEAMTAAGVQAGLAEETSYQLAVKTVIGSGQLLKKSGKTARDLRREVTSPKGTTEAALNVLMSENGLSRIMRHAIQAAFERARELSR
jgi:pyrroline-5-carboxylate reductase